MFDTEHFDTTVFDIDMTTFLMDVGLTKLNSCNSCYDLHVQLYESSTMNIWFNGSLNLVLVIPLWLTLKGNNFEQFNNTRITWKRPQYPAVSHFPSWKSHSYPELMSTNWRTKAAVIQSRSSGEADHCRLCLPNSWNRTVRKFSHLNVLLLPYSTLSLPSLQRYNRIDHALALELR